VLVQYLSMHRASILISILAIDWILYVKTSVGLVSTFEHTSLVQELGTLLLKSRYQPCLGIGYFLTHSYQPLPQYYGSFGMNYINFWKCWNFSKIIFLKEKKICKGKWRIIWNILKYFSFKMKYSKLINYTADLC
jgi:hypothetical protein